MNITFSDGVNFDMSCKLRIEERFDGLYVVGEGNLCPVNSYEKGYELIKNLKEV